MDTPGALDESAPPDAWALIFYQEGINYMKDKLGYTDVFCHDLISDPLLEAILNEKWDVYY